MPVTIRRNADGTYSVTTPNGVHSKHTTLDKAKRQRNLLNAVDHGWTPTGKPTVARKRGPRRRSPTA